MVKIISLSNEAYKKLSSIKYGKSFSEVVVELVEKTDKTKKKSLMDFYGIWKDKEKVEKIKKMIEEDRKKAKMREVTF